MISSEPKIAATTATAFSIPTDAPEADGTFMWSSTTLIIVEIRCEQVTGLGYTYSHNTAAPLARQLMKDHVHGRSPFDTNGLFSSMRKAQRNYGRDGIAATALSAIDIALWDLKAKLLDQPLCSVLGQMRAGAPVYGSGGFTTYTDEQLRAQLDGWVNEGIPRVKMKIGTHPEDDLHRVKVARAAIGNRT